MAASFVFNSIIKFNLNASFGDFPCETSEQVSSVCLGIVTYVKIFEEYDSKPQEDFGYFLK